MEVCMHKASLHNVVKAHLSKKAILLPNEGQDNSGGDGYIPLPENLDRLVVINRYFRAPLDHRVLPAYGTHILEYKLTTNFDLTKTEIQKLLQLGLISIQCGNPNTLSFWFKV
jgi:hypothetical protein